MTAQLVSVRETVRRTGVDRGLLLDRAQHRAEAELAAALAQYVMTVPNVAPYWHAAYHLGELAA